MDPAGERAKTPWLRSREAEVIFLGCSCLVIALGLFVVFMTTPLFEMVDLAAGGDTLLRIVGITLGLTGVPASLILLLGMSVFCVGHDNNPPRLKSRWLAIFLATACFGAAIYYFSVYRKQIAVHEELANG